jgi:hypothetical protein
LGGFEADCGFSIVLFVRCCFYGRQGVGLGGGGKNEIQGSLHRAAHKSVISFGRDDMALGAAVIGEAG